MRILLINKFNYLLGGVERYLIDWEAILQSRGHQTMLFSMHHPNNRPSAEEKYFADNVTFNLSLPAAERVRAAGRSIWSFHAARKLEHLLESLEHPDIAHIHSYMFQLTPAILAPLVKRKIPIVQTCHEYATVCVNQHFYNHRGNTICEACLTGSSLSSVIKRCVKGSLSASAAACAAGYAERIFGRGRKRISRFIAVSEFMRNKMIEGGIPAQRVIHVPNFTQTNAVKPAEGEGEYILFAGRLVPHKGILKFLQAASLVPQAQFRILGGGALENEVRKMIAGGNGRNMYVHGHVEGPQLWKILRQARAVVVPSEWYDPMPLIVLESMVAARAVIASRIGGIPEMVTDGSDGILVPPGDTNALASALRRVWQNPSEAVEMGLKGRAKVMRCFTPEIHYDRVMGVYEEARHDAG